MTRLFEFGKQLFIFIGLAVLILMVMDFNSRMAELTRLRAQQERELLAMNHLVATQIYLETQIAYATSEPAVEAWARQEGRLIRDGDVPVVPLPGEAFAPTPTPLPEHSQNDLTNWEAWLEWFLSNAP